MSFLFALMGKADCIHFAWEVFRGNLDDRNRKGALQW